MEQFKRIPYDVTIGIPVYNVEKYVRLAMDSALAQTFQNIEFLICDDCGIDSSINILKEYQRVHPRGKDIRIVSQPHNMGIGNARNKIIDEAQGKYLYFMDADDSIAPNTIELLYDNATRYQAELVYGSYKKVDLLGDEIKTTDYCYPAMHFSYENEFAKWAYRKYDGLPAMTWNILFDMTVFKDNQLRYKPINYWEDFTFTMDLPTYVTRVITLPDVTYNYYCRFGSASNFQKRSHIDRREVEGTIKAMQAVKGNSSRIKDRPYFSRRMFRVMMTCYYMAIHIQINKKSISPSFTKIEVRDVMRSPLSLCETLMLKDLWMKNLSLYFLGILPPTITVLLINLSIKIRQFISFFRFHSK